MHAPAVLCPPASKREELKRFLTDRRGRIDPESVGFRSSTRRRSRGLTRAQVAELSGVSFKWYTLFESGAADNVSREVVASVSGVLRLDADETEYLLALTGHVHRQAHIPSTPSFTVAQRIIDDYTGGPAAVIGPRMDLLAINRFVQPVLGYAMSDEALHRNVLFRLFMQRDHPLTPSNWEEMALQHVAVLRANYFASHLEDPGFRFLIELLLRESPEFSSIWAAAGVRSFGGEDPPLQVRHPQFGPLRFDRLGVPFGQLHYLFFAYAADERTMRCVEELRATR